MNDNLLRDSAVPRTSPLAPAGGETAHIRRFETVIRAPGDMTAGALALLEHRLPPGYLAMPRHAHAAAEAVTVLRGELSVEVSRRVRVLRAGESLVIPPMAVHAFWVSGEAAESAVFVAAVAPAGLEAYYRAVARAIGPEGRPEMEAVHAAAAAHGVTVEMDSLFELIERHELQLS
jgi:mannose-6-phosphate isomerase-like protein (cupin superfamily)